MRVIKSVKKISLQQWNIREDDVLHRIRELFTTVCDH